jgi:hypothetical protein
LTKDSMMILGIVAVVGIVAVGGLIALAMIINANNEIILDQTGGTTAFVRPAPFTPLNP